MNKNRCLEIHSNAINFFFIRLKNVKGMFVFGEPEVCVIGLGSDDFNVFRLFDALVDKGWVLNSLQFPSR